MGAAPTRSSISENLTTIVSNVYLEFTADCSVETKEDQLIDVGTNPNVFFVNQQGFPVPTLASSAGCIWCQTNIAGRLMAQYADARTSFPGVGDGDQDEIDRYQDLCQLVCTDVLVTNLQQTSNTIFKAECEITNDNHNEFVQEVESSIWQSLENNEDFLAAIVNAFGGGNQQVARTTIHNKLEQNLNVNVLAQMNTALVASQDFRVINSNSVYSSGISQQLFIDVCKSVLISNEFLAKMYQGTSIDIETDVKNDNNTIAAALAALEEINRAFARAFQNNSILLAVFIGLLVLAGTVMFFAIVMHILAEAKKRELAEFCDTKVPPSLLSEVGAQVREAKQLKKELQA